MFLDFLKCKTNTLPNAHFDYSSLFSDAQIEKVGNPKTKKQNNCERAVGLNSNKVP
jgi:hypothetical protein